MEQSAASHWADRATIPSGDRDSNFYFFCKRCLDICLAIVLLTFLLPLMVIIAILIKLDTSGPIFFTQERVGAKRRSENGRVTWEIQTFFVYKFRSMVHNADPLLHQAYIKAFIEGRVETTNASHPKFKLTNDPRVTTVGRILRKLSLDELPQLINVLRGEMSLVGPRPVPIYEAADYQARHYERLTVLPGITGIWQVQGRCQVSFEEMIQMDIQYARQKSLWLDLKILLLTLPAVLSGRGAE